jgi:hypothetical protein
MATSSPYPTNGKGQLLHLASGLPNCRNERQPIKRLQKVLEGANLKLAAVATNVPSARVDETCWKQW